ncbi:hypothetical protein, partial [Mesorhizobium sp. M1E.F.Ca.ET.041.01.1.1]|uniref:hypothetical protein n=1 Tax=Mesorhizobium sp. M1E.F.Ca.ET.041.01.1.1 TaxID=2496759 RepID=UPI00167537D9
VSMWRDQFAASSQPIDGPRGKSCQSAHLGLRFGGVSEKLIRIIRTMKNSLDEPLLRGGGRFSDDYDGRCGRDRSPCEGALIGARGLVVWEYLSNIAAIGTDA